MMVAEYECIHEEQIQAQSRKIERLEARSDFKEQRIDEINNKMDKLNEKFDKVLEGFNDLKIESTSDDKELEIRLKSIETKQTLLEQTMKQNKEDSNNRTNRLIGIVGLIFTAITIYFNFIH